MLFKQNVQTYFDLALKKLDEGDFPSGIYNLHRALGYGDDPEIRLELAEAYFDIENYALAEKYYIGVLAERPKDEDVYLGLINCYLQQNEFELAEYYFNVAVRQGILDENEMIMDEPPKAGNIKIYDRTDKSDIMNIAAKLIMSGDFDYAKQLLRSVGPEAKQYHDACSMLAIMFFNEDDYEKTIFYADRILERDPSDAYGLTCKVMAQFHLGYETELKENLALLDALGELDDRDTMRAAMCMMNIGSGERAVKYLRQAAEIGPYDRSVSVSLAVSLGAEGNFEEAKRTVITAHKLFPDDAEIKYYARLISDGDGPSLRNLMMRGFSGDEWYREIDAFMERCRDIGAAEKALKKDEAMREKVDWLFSGDNFALQSRVGQFLTQSKSWHRRLRELLLDPGLNLQVKKELFRAYLISSSDRRVKVYICGLLRVFTPRRFRKYSPLNDAYYNAFATFAFSETDFEKKLNAAYDELTRRVSETGRVPETDVAAALMYAIAGRGKKNFDRAGCCEIFKITEEEFVRAATALDPDKIYELR